MLLVRAGRRSTAAAAGAAGDPQATTPSTGSAPSSAERRRSTRWRRGGVRRDHRRRRHRRPRARRRRPRHARRLRHRHPLGRHASPSTRRSTRPSRSTCSARPASPRLLNELGVAPHLVAVSTCYVAGNRRGTAPEELVVRGPVRPRPRLAQARSPRPAGCAPTPRPRAATPSMLAALPRRGPRRARRRRRARAGRQDRAAARALGRTTSWSQAGRARAASVGWPDAYAYTKALGEQALTETKGAVPGLDRAPVDHRVGAGRAAARLDPRLPHGRAGHHLLRPRPAQGVPRRARGHGRRHPGRPRGRRHHRRRRARPDDGAAASPRSRRARPTRSSTGRSSTTCSAWFTEHPLYDTEGQPIVVPDWSFPGRGRVQGQLKRAEGVLDRAEKVLQALPLRGKQAEWSARLEEKRTEVERALEYVELYGAVRRVRGDLRASTTCWRCGTTLDADDRAAFGFDPRVIDWPRYIPEIHLPSVVEHARVKTTPGQEPTERTAATGCGARCSSPDRHLAAFDLENTLIAVERGGELLVAGHPPARPTADRVRYVLRTLARGAQPAGARPQGPRRLPALLLPPLRGRAGRADRRRRAELFSQLILTKSFPAGIRRVREHRAARPPHGADHRRARLRRRSRCGRCSTRSSPPR